MINNNNNNNLENMDVFGDTVKEVKKVDHSSLAFGIDLGTTNSAVAVVKNGEIPEMVSLNDGRKTMPSCVMWMGGDNFVVGKEAYACKGQPNVCASIKRKMGTNRKVTLEFEGKKKQFTPAFISSLILKDLVKQVSNSYDNIKDVVVTVPAYFDQNQIRDTVEAGKLAGLNVIDTFKEPTAASIVYNIIKSQTVKSIDDTVLVYDLGGGTFDISLVRVTSNSGKQDLSGLDEFASMYGLGESTLEKEDLKGMDEFSKTYGLGVSTLEKEDLSKNKTTLDVLDIDGDSKLGGDDIDDELLSILIAKLNEQGIKTGRMTKYQKAELKHRLESYKKEPGNYTINIQYIGKKEVNASVNIDEKDMAEATYRVYSRSKLKVNRVLSKIDKKSLTSIVLVGGSTYSSFIRAFLAHDFPDVTINHALNPDESVALGAAVRAKSVKFGESSLQINDILPMSIGIKSDDKIFKLIPQGAKLPYQRSRVFTTFYDNQEKVDVQVYQGNSTLVEECTLLGQLTIDNIPPRPAGTVRVSITLNVTAGGVLKVYTTVDDRTEEKTLVNLFVDEVKEEDKVETISPLVRKKLNRWKRFTKNIEDTTQREKFESLLKDFEKGEDVEAEIKDFIRIQSEEIVVETVVGSIRQSGTLKDEKC